MKKAMLISYFRWYDTRLKPIQDILSAEYEVKCYIADFVHTTKQYVTDDIPTCENIHVPKYKKNMSLARFKSYLSFGRKIRKKIREIQPDLIYLLLPPNNTAKYCRKYKLSHPAVRYYVDLLDLWPESMPVNSKMKNNWLFRRWARLRNDSFSAADHVFTECDLYRERLAQFLDPQKTMTLHLFRTAEPQINQAVQTILETKESRVHEKNISLCYLGSINNLIDIDTISRLIKSLTEADMEVDLKVIGDGQSREKLVAEAESAGASVAYYGKVFDQLEKIKLIGMCDYGLNIMKDTVSVGLTIKSVDYFSMGIPVVNSIKGDTWNLVESKHIGINLGKDTEGNIRRMIAGDSVSMGKNAFSVFKEQFTRESFMNKALTVIPVSDGSSLVCSEKKPENMKPNKA